MGRKVVLFEDAHAAHFYPITLTRPAWGVRLGLRTLDERIPAELGAELGPAFVVASYTFGFANGTSPYLNGFDLDAGLTLAGPLFAEAGFGVVSRRIALVGAETELVRGQLNDDQLLFDIGLGIAF